MLKIGRPSPIKGCSAENQQHGAFTDRPLYFQCFIFLRLLHAVPVNSLCSCHHKSNKELFFIL